MNLPTKMATLATLLLVSQGARADPWTEQTILSRVDEIDPTVASRVADERAAAARTSAVRVELTPRARLFARGVRISSIDNDPIVPAVTDAAEAAATAEQVMDPAARSLFQRDLAQQLAQADLQFEVPQNQLILGAEVRYPFTRILLEVLPALRAAEAEEDAAAPRTDVARQSVRLRAVDLFFLHARAQDALEVAELRIRDAKQNLDQAQARHQTGLVPLPELRRFEGRFAAAEGARAAASAEVVATAGALRAFLRLEGEGSFEIETDFLADPKRAYGASNVPLVEQAHMLRPELRQLEASLRATGHERKAAAGARWPTLGLSAAIETGRPTRGFVPPNEDFRTFWSLGVELAWSPDGAARAIFETHRADARTQAVAFQRQALRDAIRAEVIGAHARYQASFAELAAARRQRIAAEEALAAASRGYEQGLVDATTLLTVTVDATEARLAVVVASTEVHRLRARLDAAIGTL